MKLSTKCRYGIRAILEIAMTYGQTPVKRKEISQRQEIPDSYLENILLILKKNGIISTIRGAKGGFILNHDPADLTVYDIVKALEGTSSLVECLDFPQRCNRSRDCVTRPVYQKLQDSQDEVLKSFSFSSLLESANVGELNFCI